MPWISKNGAALDFANTRRIAEAKRVLQDLLATSPARSVTQEAERLLGDPEKFEERNGHGR